ncbi:hypothetical protein [Streptosporangium sp. NPDC004631]
MRNIISDTAGRADGVTTEYADAVRAALDTAVRGADRESTTKNKWGQYTAHAALISYASPDTGQERWALYYQDEATLEVEESTDRAEAETRYEEHVRSLADCAMEGTTWWQSTDVDGVPTSTEDDNDL